MFIIWPVCELHTSCHNNAGLLWLNLADSANVLAESYQLARQQTRMKTVVKE